MCDILRTFSNNEILIINLQRLPTDYRAAGTAQMSGHRSDIF